MPVWLLAAEVLATILSLFVFGSFRFQIHKNAVTYGMFLVAVATFCGLADSAWHAEVARDGLLVWVERHLLSFEGLDGLMHLDTMLFILGLTLFVSVVAQTRLLERITFALLRRYGGAILPTVLAVTSVVALASGIFDGVSMIGLTIRTLVIVLLLAAAPTAAIRQAVMVCTVVTTVCGMWMAYGEPPNLIMRANLFPSLGNAFFLRYCAPAALVSYIVIAWRLRSLLGTQRIALETMDVIDANLADVRFLQAARHGEVLTPVEAIRHHAADLAGRAEPVVARLRAGESLGIALVREGVPAEVRRKILGHFVAEDLAESLDRHYVLDAAGDHQGALEAEAAVDRRLAFLTERRQRAQRIAALALAPFIALLIGHGVNHHLPLFLASFGAFAMALPAIGYIPKMRALALSEARHEYAEYYFLFPLFFSISLLTQAGFFDRMQSVVHHGIAALGHAHVAFGQFIGSTVLSAILDNNVVADFASRGIRDLDTPLLHLFALAQIAGYALGGCWTHIGSAQSVVAYAFIRRDVDERYTPLQWIREMTPVVLQVLALLTLLLYAESALVSWLD